ncbi:MAG: SMC-Scp complex subunit ScpB, partial [Gammaproteobacteria bacterium]|nr:SMC-Scp complex subunit ScpB [Gammaproteobacteria bacterium]
MERDEIKAVCEATLMVAPEPVPLDRLQRVFADEGEVPERAELREILDELAGDYEGRAVELTEVASGFRFQARSEMAPWLNRMTEERSPRYSRALLETLAIIAYRQPVTRGEIEAIRGVAVSTNIIRTLDERNWIRIAG